MRLIIAFLVAAAASADTIVSVVEVGKRGVVRRTATKSTSSSASAISSFWNTLHETANSNRRLKAMQHPDATVVPDLFNKPKGGIVIGVGGSGVDLDAMPVLSKQLTDAAVGHSVVSASKDEVMAKASPSLEVASESASFSSGLEGAIQSLEAGQNRLEAVSVKVNENMAGSVDSTINDALKSVRKLAEKLDGTIVVHFVVQEENGAMRRRLAAEDVVSDSEEPEERELEQSYQMKNNFYGYGYYNDNGEWVTNYKTIFQIQYFNIVMWTSIGLVGILVMCIGHMINMPLMADTLLFGESAKMMGG